MGRTSLPLVGRGAQSNPANRFARLQYVQDLDDAEGQDFAATIRPEYYRDDSRTIISENDSPDVPFRYSLNPYRGCAHGCSYCFARPTHEYLDLSAGLDFETKIFVKERAPDLFRDWLVRPNYEPESITLSGVTDCYQPIEKQLRLTRQCLEVALEARQPVSLVTKNALITRDVDLLTAMAAQRLVHVSISVTTLNQELARVMEPRTSSPHARLRTIATLREAGVPTFVLVAPVIPGLTDHEMPAILRAVQEAGALGAGYVLLRLPLTVETVFREWLARTQPTKQAKVEARLRSMHAGKLYQSEYGLRMSGQGVLAEQIARTFEVFARRYGLIDRHFPLDTAHFRKPKPSSGQQWLFEF